MNLNLQESNFKVKKEDGISYIFDRLRNKFVVITPEELVRQHFVTYLIEKLDYPEALMGNEISLTQNGIKRRCDTIITDKFGNPLMIIEYKAPNITITQKTFNQITRYNSVFLAKYLVVFNGKDLFCCQVDFSNHSIKFLIDIPKYKDL